MEYQEIFEKVRDIVAEVIKIEQQEITLYFPLFQSEIYDKRLYWSSNNYVSHVIHFKAEDSQYYFYKPVMVGEADGLNADVICGELIVRFEDIDFPDDVFLEFATVKVAVDYINYRINQR
ncbi:acyl carrier protein [Nostoc sp.]|uniref:acyl carrier protein n=1 Tax=Nostoc sp. TaxID=1180 RepID=UPI002FF98E49